MNNSISAQIHLAGVFEVEASSSKGSSIDLTIAWPNSMSGEVVYVAYELKDHSFHKVGDWVDSTYIFSKGNLLATKPFQRDKYSVVAHAKLNSDPTSPPAFVNAYLRDGGMFIFAGSHRIKYSRSKPSTGESTRPTSITPTDVSVNAIYPIGGPKPAKPNIARPKREALQSASTGNNSNIKQVKLSKPADSSPGASNPSMVPQNTARTSRPTVLIITWVLLLLFVFFLVRLASPDDTGNVSSSHEAVLSDSSQDGSAEATSYIDSLVHDAEQNSSPTDADLAYCPGRGKLVHVGASTSYRGAICSQSGQLFYYGIDKRDGSRTAMSVSDATVNEFVSKSSDGFSHKLTSSSFSIIKDGNVIDSEPMTYWWPRGHAELVRPGDLGLDQGITYPSCDGSAVALVYSAFDPESYREDVKNALDAFPGSSYLRTDLACDNFRTPSIDNSGGNYIYAVYYPLGNSSREEICKFVEPFDGYGDILANGVDQMERVICP